MTICKQHGAEASSLGVDRPFSRDKVACLESFARRRAPRPDSRAGAAPVLDPHDLQARYEALEIDFDPDLASLWCTFRHDARPCFTPRLLADIRRLQSELRHGLAAAARGGRMPLRSVVWASDAPDSWNLGGDLALFVELIRAGDAERLRRYAHDCVDVVYQNLCKLDLPLLIIALVQGDALGGGFEAVLTNDVVIAERGAKFGLPEILFNMFPGMGAYSLLCRRLDGSRAQQLILSGRLYEAEELEQMGLVDMVVEPGDGPAAVRQYLVRNERRLGVLNALSEVRRRCQPVDYEELIDVTDLWVATALALEDADLRRMERLAGAQQRRRARVGGPAVAPARLSAAG